MGDMAGPVTGPVVVISGPAPRLTGYAYWWIKRVVGFNPKQHCAKCLEGRWLMVGADRVRVGIPTALHMRPGEVAYACGVTEGFKWTQNFHLPFVAEAGATAELGMVNGQRMTIRGARALLPIPPLPKGWAGLNGRYTTCRNFQFAVAHFKTTEAAVRAANRGLFDG